MKWYLLDLDLIELSTRICIYMTLQIVINVFENEQGVIYQVFAEILPAIIVT